MMRWLAISAGMLALLCGLVGGAPASRLLPRVVGNVPSLSTYEVSGTLMQGRIGMLQFGRFRIEDAAWTFRPLALLRGAAAADVEARIGGARVQAGVQHGLSGTTVVRDLRATLAVADLKPLLNLPFLPVEGQLSAQMERIEIADGRPREAEGVVRLGNTQFMITRPPSQIGEFEAQITTTDDGITATVQDREAALEFSGNGLLDDQGAYRFEARMRPRPTAPTPLSNNIRAMGRPDAQGWQTLRYNGRLPGTAAAPPAKP